MKDHTLFVRRAVGADLSTTMVVVPVLRRYMASGLPQPTLGCHLQCYVAAKVHSKQAAYSSAMSAILTGLEQHKQVQPEIAVFCRVRTDPFTHVTAASCSVATSSYASSRALNECPFTVLWVLWWLLSACGFEVKLEGCLVCAP